MSKEQIPSLAWGPQILTQITKDIFKSLTHVDATESERVAAQIHRYMELRYMLEEIFRNMSNLRVEDYENLAKVKGPTILYAPHQFSMDWLGIGVAVEDFLRITYLDQIDDKREIWDLATWMGRYAGGIKVNNPLSSMRKILKALGRDEKILVFPEGVKGVGGLAVGSAINNNVVEIPYLFDRCKKVGEQKPEIPLIPVGLEYIESPSRRPWPKIDIEIPTPWGTHLKARLGDLNIPTPWATRLTVRFGEPIYTSEHPDWEMDNYMKIVADLSNRPFVPDLVNTAV